MPEDRLKSAYEVAMERLRAEDRDRGVEPARPLTKAQKKRIAELRQEAKAKLADLEVQAGEAQAARTIYLGLLGVLHEYACGALGVPACGSHALSGRHFRRFVKRTYT